MALVSQESFLWTSMFLVAHRQLRLFFSECCNFSVRCEGTDRVLSGASQGNVLRLATDGPFLRVKGTAADSSAKQMVRTVRRRVLRYNSTSSNYIVEVTVCTLGRNICSLGLTYATSILNNKQFRATRVRIRRSALNLHVGFPSTLVSFSFFLSFPPHSLSCL